MCVLNASGIMTSRAWIYLVMRSTLIWCFTLNAGKGLISPANALLDTTPRIMDMSLLLLGEGALGIKHEPSPVACLTFNFDHEGKPPLGQRSITPLPNKSSQQECINS